MKKIIHLIFTGLATICEAQNTSVTYDVLNQDRLEQVDLIFCDSISVFNVKNTSTSQPGNFFFQKNRIEGYSYSTIRFMNVEFHVKDSLDSFMWELTKDSFTILNMKCLGAKTTFRGRDYVGYYSQDFSISEGPWKFGGLPGLILSIRSTDGFVKWEATKIVQNYSGKIEMKDVAKYKFLQWNEFVQKYKSTVQKYVKLARSNGVLSNDSDASIKVTSVEIFYPELQTGEGIKF
jgi:GLPGLI family protein